MRSERVTGNYDNRHRRDRRIGLDSLQQIPPVEFWQLQVEQDDGRRLACTLARRLVTVFGPGPAIAGAGQQLCIAVGTRFVILNKEYSRTVASSVRHDCRGV